MTPLRSLPYVGLLAACILFTGCKDRNSIQTYRATKEESPRSAEDPHASVGMPPMMPGGADKAGSKAGCPMTGSADQTSVITDTAPKGWEKQPPSSMRQASYLVKGKEGAQADISLIILGGAAGGSLDNVNRWLAQLGQAAITQEQLGGMSQTVSSPMGKVMVVDLQGKPSSGDASKDGRILAGMVGVDGATWFYKMRGNAEVVGAEKQNFLKWIASVKRAAAVPATSASQGAAPIVPVAASTTAAPREGGQEKPKVSWSQPKAWQPSQGSSMRYASFSAKDSDGKTADISVSFLPGQAGTDLENVNRWRGQMGLTPVAEADLQAAVFPVTCRDGSLKMMELAGGDAKMLVAWTRVDGNTWFFKLTAPVALADRQKPAFKGFLESVKFRP